MVIRLTVDIIYFEYKGYIDYKYKGQIDYKYKGLYR